MSSIHPPALLRRQTQTVTSISLSTISDIQKLLRTAGEIALSRRVTAKVHLKSDMTPFTDIELDMEALILPFLRERFPDYQILSEENGTQGPVKPAVWALDPIDGTKIFLNGLPTWGVSLGSIVNGRPALGFFYMPVTHDFYWGGEGFGAFLNDKPLPLGIERDLDDPLSFLAIPSNGHRYFEFDYPRLRCFGSTAAHCCYVAQGAATGALLRRVNLWDLAGVLPILSQAGVQVEYYSQGAFSPEPYLNGGKIKEEILVAREPILGKMRTLIRRK